MEQLLHPDQNPIPPRHRKRSQLGQFLRLCEPPRKFSDKHPENASTGARRQRRSHLKKFRKLFPALSIVCYAELPFEYEPLPPQPAQYHRAILPILLFAEKMTIRRYQTGEEEAIWEVYFRATHETNSRDYHPDLLHRWAPEDKDMNEWRNRLSEMKPWVALIDGKIAGMAEIEERGFIHYFYVHPEFQSRGIGAALLERIESEATNMGLTSVFADVSLTARSFFEQRGFVVTEARSNVILGHPAPNYSMSKALKNSEQGGPPNAHPRLASCLSLRSGTSRATGERG